MFKTIQGIYINGKIELNEIPENIPSRTPVIITFLAEDNLEESSQKITNYHELDFLAGTWTKEDEIEFLGHTNDFSKIDENLWK